jgi:hypothetical protein
MDLISPLLPSCPATPSLFLNITNRYLRNQTKYRVKHQSFYRSGFGQNRSNPTSALNEILEEIRDSEHDKIDAQQSIHPDISLHIIHVQRA